MSDSTGAEGNTVRVSINASGERTVEWSVNMIGESYDFQHQLPDAVTHHYKSESANIPIPLFEGAFKRNDDATSFHGAVLFRWFPTPRVEASGSRPAIDDDFNRILNGSNNATFWVDPLALDIDLIDSELPAQPEAISGDPANLGYSFTDRVEQTLGDPSGVECVTFMVPNGWQGIDGEGVCDPNDLTATWRGRTRASGDGWQVTIDRNREMDNDAWKELAELGGYRFTHTGRLQRADGGAFNAADAFGVLDRVRIGMNLALGRRTTCALPVGWRGDKPIWARWRSSPIDPYSSSSHWLDETIAYRQVGEVLSEVLDFTADEANREALRPAVAYYVAGNVDVDVELSVSVPLSGLQLLSYYTFVTEKRNYSQTQWDNALSTEDQIRLLINDTGVDTSVPTHFAHLVSVQQELARNAPQRDLLGIVVKMRNVVTHPERDKPSRFSPYEWAEAGMHARYWLCLALLKRLDYRGEIASVLGDRPRWTGQVRPVPWM